MKYNETIINESTNINKKYNKLEEDNKIRLNKITVPITVQQDISLVQQRNECIRKVKHINIIYIPYNDPILNRMN